MSAIETSRGGDTGALPASDLEASVIQLPGGSLIAYRLLAERVRRLLADRRFRIPAAARAELEREILDELRQALSRPDFDPPGGALGFVEAVTLQHVVVWQRDRKTGESVHPADDLLVRSAVAAGLLSAPERQRLEAHLAGCRACREMVALAGDALSSARRVETGRGPRPLVFRAAPWLALAALPILALALAFLIRPAALPEDPVAREAVAPGSDAAVPGAPAADWPTVPTGEGVATVAGDPLSGTRRVEARRAIVATGVTIEADSEVTFRAGEVVVLGDGFAIAAGAALTIEIAGTPPADAPDRRD